MTSLNTNSPNRNNRSIINRELKIDDSRKDVRDYREIEDYLKTISRKFLKEPATIENLDKAYSEMLVKANKEKTDKNHHEIKTKSKRVEEKSIFYDIFIKPKENKIKEIRLKRDEQKTQSNNKKGFDSETNMFISNKTSGIDKNGKNKYSFNNSINKSSIQDSSILMSKKDSQSMIEVDMSKQKKDDVMGSNGFIANEPTHASLMAFLKEKFVPSDPNSLAKKNFFNQLIQIRPPEGINAISASPLIDSNKGWAPSIPSLSASKMKTNLQDLFMRAKGGIQAGDIPKEAHMAFYLGVMNEEEKNYEEALKFYKKYFLSAKLLQDVYGTELALNRISVLYSNILIYDQALVYSETHKEITTHNVNGFVAFYNCGVCQRILGKMEDSSTNFNRALQMAEEENDLESYTLCICQMAINFLFIGNINSYFEYVEEFYVKNKTLKHAEMELEIQMMTGFIENFCGNLEMAKESYLNALRQSTTYNSEYYKALSLCNIGIVEANKEFDEYLENLNQ